MSRVGIVTGMSSEAARATDASAALPKVLRPLVFVAGGDSGRAREGARALIIQGADVLLSFGLVGGLDSALATGDVLLAKEVVLPDGSRIETDQTWRSSLEGSLAGRARTTIGALAGQDRVVATVAAKAALRAASGALAVDMESHGVALAAKEAGVPFMALRVVLDPATHAVPWSAQAGLAADGSTHVLPVAARLLLKPWEIAALIALGRANRRALEVLGRLAVDLSPAFGFGM